jgi:hypothetical protein
MFHKRTIQEERNLLFQKVMVGYEAIISFDTFFLVHYYDSVNMPFLLEKKGRYFQLNDMVPFQRSSAYFRIHVFNPLCLEGQTVTLKIRVKNEVAVEKTFTISNQQNFADWHSVKAILI